MLIIMILTEYVTLIKNLQNLHGTSNKKISFIQDTIIYKVYLVMYIATSSLYEDVLLKISKDIAIINFRYRVHNLINI